MPNFIQKKPIPTSSHSKWISTTFYLFPSGGKGKVVVESLSHQETEHLENPSYNFELLGLKDSGLKMLVRPNQRPKRQEGSLNPALLSTIPSKSEFSSRDEAHALGHASPPHSQ